MLHLDLKRRLLLSPPLGSNTLIAATATCVGEGVSVALTPS